MLVLAVLYPGLGVMPEVVDSQVWADGLKPTMAGGGFRLVNELLGWL
jgi:hypothetical protein